MIDNEQRADHPFGKPVARLVPVDSSRKRAREAAARIIERGQNIERVPLQQLLVTVHEGRSALKSGGDTRFIVYFRAMDLIDLLKRSESKTLEFKRDLSSPDSVLRTIVAFANTAGGVLLLGVEDATRNVRGVAEPLAALTEN